MKLTHKKTLALVSTSALATGVAHGAILYNYYDQTIVAGGNDQFTFDLNDDGSPDFLIEFDNNNALKPYIDNSVEVSAPTTCFVLSDPNNSGLPITPAGTTIDSSYQAPQNDGYFYNDANNNTDGEWDSNGTNVEGYVGLELMDSGGNPHFGWAHFIYNSATVENGVTGVLTLVDAAMETGTNTAILTGQTAEPGSCPAAFIPPASLTNYVGSAIQLSVVATGNPAPAYQWMAGAHGSGSFTNLSDGGNTSGTVSNILTITNTTLANSEDYVVSLSNSNCAAVRSPVATVTLLPTLIEGVSPSPADAYVGRHLTLSVAYGSSVPVQFQWLKGGSPISDGGDITGSTSSNLVFSALAAGDSGNYSVAISNIYGVVTSAVDVVSVTVPPTPYEQAVLALGAFSHYDLNETTDPASSNAIAFDYIGGLNGVYGSQVENGNAKYNIAGPRPSDGFLGFATNNYAMLVGPAQHSPVSWVTTPAPNLNTNTVTFVEWINPGTAEADWSVLLTYRGAASGTATGMNYDANGNLGYHWNDTGSTYNFDSALLPPVSQWSMVALAVAPTNASIYMFNSSGAFETNNPVEHDVQAFNNPGHIGGDTVDGNFTGVIDEVSIFNQTLSSNQLASLYQVAVTGTNTSPVGPVNLSIAAAGGQITLSWPQGTLLESTSVSGPWTTNAAASPYTLTPAGPQMFYKLLMP